MRKGIGLVAVLALGGCSLPPKVIRAVARDGHVVFDAFEPGNCPFGGQHVEDMTSDTIQVMHDKDMLWMITRSGAPRCSKGPRKPLFPLRYGEVPDCYEAKVPAKPLRAEVTYRVLADYGINGPRGGDGYFKLGLTPVNLRYEDDPEVRNWAQDAQFPDNMLADDPENSVMPDNAN